MPPFNWMEIGGVHICVYGRYTGLVSPYINKEDGLTDWSTCWDVDGLGDLGVGWEDCDRYESLDQAKGWIEAEIKQYMRENGEWLEDELQALNCEVDTHVASVFYLQEENARLHRQLTEAEQYRKNCYREYGLWGKVKKFFGGGC